jgi:SAM-dependent methyltransferase
LELITQTNAFQDRFPLPTHLQPQLTAANKQAFAQRFVQVRDEVERHYYADADNHTSAGTRTRRFLGALINPIIGRPVNDAEHFYQTFGRLMRWAWLSISVGIYDDDITAVPEPDRRLHTAQVNTVDIAWRPTISRQPEDGLIVEVGTGRGNSIARLAQLFPRARIVSITISPEQASIAQQIIQQMGVTNVEVRLGNIFDRSVSRDLLGQADAVSAIEVTGHFHYDRKAEGIGIFASLLKPGAPLSVLDAALAKPLSPFMMRYYENQSWYFGSRDGYLTAFETAGVQPISYVDYSQAVIPTFPDTTVVLRQHRAQLRREFGRAMALVWPELPGSVYLRTMKNTNYVHVVGIKQVS